MATPEEWATTVIAGIAAIVTDPARAIDLRIHLSLYRQGMASVRTKTYTFDIGEWTVAISSGTVAQVGGRIGQYGGTISTTPQPYVDLTVLDADGNTITALQDSWHGGQLRSLYADVAAAHAATVAPERARLNQMLARSVPGREPGIS